MTKRNHSSLQSKVWAEIREAEKSRRRAGMRDASLIYWSIGLVLEQNEPHDGWSEEALTRLLADVRQAFPDELELSIDCLRVMQTFCRAYPKGVLLEQREMPKPKRRRATTSRKKGAPAPASSTVAVN